MSNGAGNQLTRDAEPFLARCRSGPVIKAIKDGAFRTDAVEDVGYQSAATTFRKRSAQSTPIPPPVRSIEISVFKADL